MAATIYAELVKLTGVEPKRYEKKDGYIIRLLKALDALPEEKWKGLPKSVQNWYNDSVQALKEKKSPELPEGAPDFKGEEEEKSDKKAPVKSDKVEKKPADKDKKAPAKVEKSEKPAKKAASMFGLFRELVCKNPGKTYEQIVALAEQKEIKLSSSTMATQYHNAHAVIGILRRLGQLPEVPEKGDKK
jgi:hypothetical protein